MLIKILQQTSIAGLPARVGQLIEANDSDAALLVAMNKATPADDDPPPAATFLAPGASPRHRKSNPLT